VTFRELRARRQHVDRAFTLTGPYTSMLDACTAPPPWREGVARLGLVIGERRLSASGSRRSPARGDFSSCAHFPAFQGCLFFCCSSG